MYNLIIFLPLIGSILAWAFGDRLKSNLSFFSTIFCMILAMLFSWYGFFDIAINKNQFQGFSYPWLNSGNLYVNWELKFDTLSIVMMMVVTTVSCMVHIYSIGYMSHDHSKSRFMAYLSFFTFAMLILVSSNNLLQLFVGWEGVGVASYLLIGFWYKKKSANRAAIKAFVVNRIGDLGFAIGLIFIYMTFQSLDFDKIFQLTPSFVNISTTIFNFEVNVLEFSCFMLFIGAMGKSAQLFLHTWLPDAMEGPTPVSALIHAATMVTAGVFMVCRLSPIFEYAPFVLNFITIIGALTALFASTVALTQFDIKRVIAYSTCSQLGYMFFAAGLSAYPAAMFHLTTHAFFKALLFLCAGSVIHGLSNEQDMRKMGGIWRKIPITYALMWVGSLALAGVPFFAGFYSKDLILEAAWASKSTFGPAAFWLGSIAAFMTAFYSWRLLFLTFHGKPKFSEDVSSKIHESPLVMLFPLFILAIGAIASGVIFYDSFVGHHWHDFWGHSIFILKENNALEMAHYVPSWVKILPILLALSGILFAFIYYFLFTGLPKKTAEIFYPIYLLFYNKWYFDEIYNLVFVKGFIKAGNLFWKYGDILTIDKYGPDGVSKIILRVSSRSVILQSGYLYHYAFAMLIGVVTLVSWLFLDFGF